MTAAPAGRFGPKTTLGIALGGPYAALPELGRQVESRGFDAVWVLEATQDPFVQATILAGATERIDIGTNIALAFPRSPTVTAMMAWDLNEISGDRFVLGLGSQVRRIVEERYSSAFDRPAKRMEEFTIAQGVILRVSDDRDAQGEDLGDVAAFVAPAASAPVGNCSATGPNARNSRSVGRSGYR